MNRQIEDLKIIYLDIKSLVIAVIKVPMFVRMLPSDHSGDSCQSGSPSKLVKLQLYLTLLTLTIQ